MDAIKIIILSLVSEVVLFISTKIIGNRQISQLSLFDYITGITIGSMAAQMATDLDTHYYQPLIGMLVYALVSVTISVAISKSVKIRRFITGNSLILLDNGELYRKNFKTAKLDLNEFLLECRTNGFFNINDIQTAILESNGKISFLPKTEKRPVNPSDMNLKPEAERATINVILDGHVIKENLKHTGNDEMWLQKELSSQKIDKLEDVFLAICDNSNKLSIYTKKDISNSHDFFD